MSGQANSSMGSFGAILPGVVQVITTSGANQQSAALQAGTSIVMILTTVAAKIAIGSNPDATKAAQGVLVPANTPMYFGCSGGQKVGATWLVGAGALYIVEGA